MQRHVHARADRRPVDHGDRRLADQRDVAVQLGEAVIEMLARRIRALMRAAVAGKVEPVTSAGARDLESAPAQKTRGRRR